MIGIDEGLREVDRMAVHPLPVSGQHGRHVARNVRSQMRNPDPRQNEEARVVSNEANIAPARLGAPSRITVAAAQMTRGRTPCHAGDGAALRPHQILQMLAQPRRPEQFSSSLLPPAPARSPDRDAPLFEPLYVRTLTEEEMSHQFDRAMEAILHLDRTSGDLDFVVKLLNEVGLKKYDEMNGNQATRFRSAVSHLDEEWFRPVIQKDPSPEVDVSLVGVPQMPVTGEVGTVPQV